MGKYSWNEVSLMIMSAVEKISNLQIQITEANLYNERKFSELEKKMVWISVTQKITITILLGVIAYITARGLR